MNAKNMLKLMEKCTADARECYPNDACMRSMFFVVALANELDLLEEPLGPQLRALSSARTNADYVPANIVGDAA
ncbi:hypothetical protein ACEN9F_13495 [Duganella sp. CT11-25]|uniref:hypothetical protein n=1 Tax=unclassified Duganella TaxID=2636909 RepID=UPI0039AEF851